MTAVATGVVSGWALDQILDIVGVDAAGDPFVLRRVAGTESNSAEHVVDAELMLMHGSSNAELIGRNGQLFPVQLTIVADGDRTWFSASGQRIWTYAPSTGLMLFNESSNKSLPNNSSIAGGCA